MIRCGESAGKTAPLCTDTEDEDVVTAPLLVVVTTTWAVSCAVVTPTPPTLTSPPLSQGEALPSLTGLPWTAGTIVRSGDGEELVTDMEVAEHTVEACDGEVTAEFLFAPPPSEDDGEDDEGDEDACPDPDEAAAAAAAAAGISVT